jgi:hypothetical protein
MIIKVKITQLDANDYFYSIRQWVYSQIWLKDTTVSRRYFMISTYRMYKELIDLKPAMRNHCDRNGIDFISSIIYKEEVI